MLLCNCVIVTFLLMLVTTTQTLNLINICLTLLLFLHFVATNLENILTEGPESQIDINVSDVQKPLETNEMRQGSDDHDVMWCHLEILVSNLSFSVSTHCIAPPCQR